MTRFTVTWWEAASAELTELWLASADRASITVAADEIDTELRDRPLLWAARSAQEPHFINAGVLRAYFTVSEPDCRVEVFKVVPIKQLPE